MDEILKVFTETTDMEWLLAYLDEFELISYDTETTGLTRDDEVVGLSVAVSETEGYYCVIAYWDPVAKELIRNPAAKAICKKIVEKVQSKSVVMHNAIFDCRVTNETWRVELIDSVLSDTMIAAHVLDEEGPRGLKELARIYFGEDSTKEQREMKASVVKNGGIWQDKKKDSIKEMYKADPQILGKYGAKDTVLTLKLFNRQHEELVAQGLDQFFYEDESMPLLREVTYDLNTVGLRVDVAKMKQYESEMQFAIGSLKAELDYDLSNYLTERPKFSLTSPQELSWLLFIRLGNKFRSLTKGGKAFAKANMPRGRIPYSDAEKRTFISTINHLRNDAIAKLAALEERNKPKIADIQADRKAAQKFKNRKGATAEEKVQALEILAELDGALKQIEAPAKFLRSQANKLYPHKYIQADKYTLEDLSAKYPWMKKLLKMRSEQTLLGTYIQGIQERVRYGIVYPTFKQTGTDSGRYSSSDPNFQNLPRDDKRVKSCILARPGKVFVGADYSQLEPRVFASVSQDPRLLECFRNGEDFYSVVGIGIFGRHECSAYKKDKNSFAVMYPDERQVAKAVCLASAYGTQASNLAQKLRHADGTNFTTEECQDIINRYFKQFPGVKRMMLNAHETAKRDGIVFNLYGRPRRIPDAIRVARQFPNVEHSKLKYEERSVLNLAMNFPVQSSGASIINRAAIAFKRGCKMRAFTDPRWKDVKITAQIHDELHAECLEEIAEDVRQHMQECMEMTTELPGVGLVAEPKIAHNMSELK